MGRFLQLGAGIHGGKQARGGDAMRGNTRSSHRRRDRIPGTCSGLRGDGRQNSLAAVGLGQGSPIGGTRAPGGGAELFLCGSVAEHGSSLHAAAESRGETMSGRKGPVFVLGCPRSGTTVLYHMLLSAGDFAIYRAESNVFSVMVPRFGNLRSERNRRRLMQY